SAPHATRNPVHHFENGLQGIVRGNSGAESPQDTARQYPSEGNRVRAEPLLVDEYKFVIHLEQIEWGAIQEITWHHIGRKVACPRTAISRAIRAAGVGVLPKKCDPWFQRLHHRLQAAIAGSGLKQVPQNLAASPIDGRA